MKDATTAFPSVNCDIDTVRDLVCANVCEGQFGYFLIEGRLVPYVFLDFLADCLADIAIDYNAVFSPREMCGEELWDSLDEDEQHVAGHCLLLLIEQGRLEIAFGDTH